MAVVFVAVFIISTSALSVVVEANSPCPKFSGTPFPGGYIKKNGYLHSETVTFGCRDPAVIDGYPTLRCNNGKWNSSLPTCGAPCKQLSPPQNGIFIKNGLKHKEKVVFGCNVGYRLVGTSEKLCNFGVWSDPGKMPVCDVVTCIAPNISKHSGIVAVASGYTYGATIKFSCRGPNYILSGKDLLTCEANGEWCYDVPSCLAPCRVTATNLISKKKVYRHGEYAQVKCKGIFSFFAKYSKNSQQCVNGQWIGASFPSCGKKKRKRRFRSWIKSKVRKIG